MLVVLINWGKIKDKLVCFDWKFSWKWKLVAVAISQYLPSFPAHYFAFVGFCLSPSYFHKSNTSIMISIVFILKPCSAYDVGIYVLKIFHELPTRVLSISSTFSFCFTELVGLWRWLDDERGWCNPCYKRKMSHLLIVLKLDGSSSQQGLPAKSNKSS